MSLPVLHSLVSCYIVDVLPGVLWPNLGQIGVII